MATTRTLPTSLWPQVDDIVSPDLPPDVAVARLMALVRSLLIENRQLRELVAATSASSDRLEVA